MPYPQQQPQTNAKTPITQRGWLLPPTTETGLLVGQSNALQECLGCNPSYVLGELWQDTGYIIIGAAIHATQPILGLHQFTQTPAIKKILATTNDATGANTELWYSTGTTFTQIASTSAWNGVPNARVEMADFNGYCFLVGYNGSSFLTTASLQGTTFSTSAQVTGAPKGKYVVSYRSRVYIGNVNDGAAKPYRVDFSSVPTAGNITWDPTLDFFDINQSSEVTGMGVNWDRLIVFSGDSAYMYDEESNRQIFFKGCVAHRTIQNVGAYMVWCAKDNIYVSVSGGREVPIGNDILQLYRNSAELAFIPDSTKLCASVTNNEYNLYLGATSANGVSYTNCLATYNFDRGMWRWRELANEPLSMAWTDLFFPNPIIFGDVTGDVFRKALPNNTSVFTDNGTAIKSRFRTQPMDMGSPEVLKAVTQIIAYAQVPGNLKLSYRVFTKDSATISPFKDLGTMTQNIQYFNKRLDGHFIQFQGEALSSVAPWIFWGFTLLTEASSHAS